MKILSNLHVNMQFHLKFLEYHHYFYLLCMCVCYFAITLKSIVATLASNSRQNNNHMKKNQASSLKNFILRNKLKIWKIGLDFLKDKWHYLFLQWKRDTIASFLDILTPLFWSFAMPLAWQKVSSWEPYCSEKKWEKSAWALRKCV